MVKRTLLTWNLHKEDPPLELVVRYVKRLQHEGHEYVVALQESLDDADQVRARTGGYAYGNGGIVLLSSQPLDECERHNRFVMAVVSFGGATFVVFNYHGHSRTELLPLEARGGYASEYRWVFNDLAKGRDTIIMGDFNAKPDDEEISHRACFSFHGRGDPAPRTLVSHHNSRRNDLRVVAPPPGDGPTHIYQTGEHADRSLVYDYFVVSAPLVPKLVVEVVKELDGDPLGDIDGRPTKSDHYPVRARWTV
jgi:hypothetical protein